MKRGLALIKEYIILTLASLIVLAFSFGVFKTLFEKVSVKNSINRVDYLAEVIKESVKKSMIGEGHYETTIYVPDHTSIRAYGNIIVIHYSNPDTKESYIKNINLNCEVNWDNVPSREGLYRMIVITKVKDSNKLCDILSFKLSNY